MFSMNTLLVITNTIGGLSVILNLCLLTLISFNTPAQLGVFRKNYYGMTVVDTLFALAQFLAAPCFFSDGSVYFIFSSRSGGSYLLIFFMVMHNTSFVSISFNFYCRYLMVCNNAISKLLNGNWARRLYYLFNIGEIVCSLVAVFIVFHIPSDCRRDLNINFSARLKINFESDFILGSAQETFSFFGYYSELFRYVSFIVFIMFGLFNMSITYLCGTGMFAYIKHHSSSNRMRLINYRNLVILTTQASMSALCVYTPGLITAVFELIEYDGSNLAEIISSLMSFATLFTPAIVILLTREYRTKMVAVLLKCSNGPPSTRTIQSNSGTVATTTIHSTFYH